MSPVSQKFRRDRASDLEMIGSVLEKNSICLDTSPIYSAASMCRTNKPAGEDSWGYSLSGLSFRFKQPKKTKPDDISASLHLELHLKIEGTCNDEWDCLNSLSLDIEITGKNNDGHKALSSWHFDRHEWSEGDGEPEEIHPLYHCHHGGRRMKNLDDFGKIMLLNPPRIACPPMDAILAIDFVLANFLPDRWKSLRDDSTYAKRLHESQRIILLPYFETITEEIRNKNGSHPSHLWPMN